MVKRVFFVCVAAVIFAALSFGASEALKRNPGFCVSCHLDDGTPLHAEKNRLFLQSPAVNLAALHRQRVPQGFACAGCHDGHSRGMKVKVAWTELANTARFIFGSFDEPKKLDAGLMPDENCEGCHKELKAEKGSFHGLPSHRPKVKVPCAACHHGHVEGRRDFHFLDEGKVLAACRKCHQHIPATYAFGPGASR